MRTQKELKEVFKNESAKVWGNDTRMHKWAMGQAAYIVELSDGDIIEIEKPSIKKGFCFGYGMYATATDEEFYRAEEKVEAARKNVDYFINENLAPINGAIEALQKDHRNVYTFLAYSGMSEGDLLKSYSIFSEWETPESEEFSYKFNGLSDLKKLSSDDIQKIIDGLQEVKQAFIKRLNTYLKKYGLSNVNAWSYIRD